MKKLTRNNHQYCSIYPLALWMSATLLVVRLVDEDELDDEELP